MKQYDITKKILIQIYNKAGKTKIFTYRSELQVIKFI